jgi:methylglutaconyl-CoA hydratase
MTDATLYDVAGGVATITLNRSDNRNALSVELVNSLGDNMRQAMWDDAVRVIVLTNESNTFCAGADLKGGSTEEPRHTLVGILEAMQDGTKPVVGRIAGHCTGGGNGLAAACDVSIAADDVFFAFTEVRIGVAPAIISVVCLPKLRRADAAELFLTGNRCPAPRAAEIGLINKAVPRDQLDAAVNELVGDLAAAGPKAIAAAKELVYKVPYMDRSDAFAWTEKLSADLFRSDEAAEGIRAFREKSKPSWVPD